MAQAVQKQRGERFSHWVFTVFDKFHYEMLVDESQDVFDESVRYCVFQEEVCPETKKAHLQGYIEFHNATTMNKVKHYVGDKAHLESRRGSRDKARAYCMKDDTRKPGTMPIEYGKWNPTGQGNRTDLQTFVSVMRTDGMREAIRSNPSVYVKFHAGMERLREYDVSHEPRNVQLVCRLWRRGDFCVQSAQGEHERKEDLFNGYRGEKSIFVASKHLVRRWMLSPMPFTVQRDRRFAEWVEVVYPPEDYEDDGLPGDFNDPVEY